MTYFNPIGTTLHILTLSAPPVFLPSPSEVKTIEGTSSVTLPCPASSEPPPTITWYFQQMILTFSDKYTIDPAGTLTVFEVNPQDAGIYTCMAANVAGTKTRTLTLKVGGEFCGEGSQYMCRPD